MTEYKLLETWKEEDSLAIESRIDLSGLNLTKLHNNHYFSFFEEVNLSGNELENSLCQLVTLQGCKKLSLSSNGLTSLKRFPTLRGLEVLCMRNNKLTSTDEILDLIKRHENLERLDIRNNLVCDEIDVAEIHNINPRLEVCLK